MVNDSSSWFKKTLPRLLLATIWLVGMLSGCISRFAATRISVVDEETGNPVSGASVNCSYACINFDPWSGPKANTYWYRKTGDDNMLWIFGHGNAPSVNAWIDTPPDGYYRGHAADKSFWAISFFCPIPIWLPPVQNLRVGVLKKLNPIPMYSGSVVAPYYFDYPKAIERRSNWTETVAYDCVAGDWCAPYGQGRINDLVFTYRFDYSGNGTNQWGNPVTYYRLERKLTFSNPDDGFQPVSRDNNIVGRPTDLVAPTEGYLPEHTSYYGETLDHGWRVSDDTHVQFYFRIRTTRDANGKLIGGHYGRISGRYSGYLGLKMEYILNPTPLDTNLEFNGTALKPGR
ncbi:MAG: hypothetical protein IT583_07605 [Verrucomicrobia bacterium]|nr:hypothetical protein [Verrucomicrobiota bacterium]